MINLIVNLLKRELEDLHLHSELTSLIEADGECEWKYIRFFVHEEDPIIAESYDLEIPDFTLNGKTFKQSSCIASYNRKPYADAIQIFRLFDTIFDSGGNFIFVYDDEALTSKNIKIFHSYILYLLGKHEALNRHTYLTVGDDYKVANEKTIKSWKNSQSVREPEERLEMGFDKLAKHIEGGFVRLQKRFSELERTLLQEAELRETRQNIKELLAKAEAARKEADLYEHL